MLRHIETKKEIVAKWVTTTSTYKRMFNVDLKDGQKNAKLTFLVF